MSRRIARSQARQQAGKQTKSQARSRGRARDHRTQRMAAFSIQRVSRHCLLRLAERGISIHELQEVLDEGVEEPAGPERVLMRSSVSDLVAVVAVAESGARTVMTAFRRRDRTAAWSAQQFATRDAGSQQR